MSYRGKTPEQQIRQICEDMVREHVIACISDLVTVGDGEHDTFEPIEFENWEAYNCSEFGDPMDRTCEDCEHPWDCPSCEMRIAYEADSTHEWHEAWLVSQWLGKQLQNRKEMIRVRIPDYIWLRRATGQSVALDTVIESIAEDRYTKYYGKIAIA
jgi:hypothetical protein